LAIALLITALGAGRALGQTASDPALPHHLLETERNTIRIFREVSPSVVFVTNTQRRRSIFTLNVMEIPKGSGSGFLWDEAGHVVTNYHVLAGGNAFSATLADGKTYATEYVGGAPDQDIAVLRILDPPPDLDPVRIGDSSGLLVGQKVLAIGNPFGLDQTLTTGIISALGREIRSMAGNLIEDVIQTDASINPGNSGGPLLDSSGTLIGVNTAIVSPSGSSAGIGFAVPVNSVRRIVPQLIAHGHVRRAGLGVRLLGDEYARRFRVEGVIIRDVIQGGAAEKAGLQPLIVDRRGHVRSFDVIIGIDDTPIRNYNDLYSALHQRSPGEWVEVRYLRGGRETRTRLRLQEIH
jgi:S1-C subfamily serine protease